MEQTWKPLFVESLNFTWHIFPLCVWLFFVLFVSFFRKMYLLCWCIFILSFPLLKMLYFLGWRCAFRREEGYKLLSWSSPSLFLAFPNRVVFSFLRDSLPPKCPYLQNEMLPTLSVEASLVAQMVKNPPAMQETWVQSLGWEDPLEQDMATHSSIPALRIPWIEEPGRLQSMELQRVRLDWSD